MRSINSTKKYYGTYRLSLDCIEKEKKFVFDVFIVDPVHCLRDSQVQKNANIKLKLGLTAVFTHLKTILLQCFQFSTISGIQTDS